MESLAGEEMRLKWLEKLVAEFKNEFRIDYDALILALL
jgi:hypothetical protein